MESNELMHPVGNDKAWSESYYFNFVDPDSGIGMFTRMGFRPNNGWADALHVIYLGEKRVAFTYGRRDIGTDLTQYDGDLTAGNLKLTCEAHHDRWRIEYDGPAQDIENAEILLTRSKERPDGWFKPARLSMNLTFSCLTEPHYAAKGERGHFEQSGVVEGSIQLGDETFEVKGYGVRDKSWGPRDWGAGSAGDTSNNQSESSNGPSAFVNWFSMNFGEYASLGGSCFRHKDGEMRGEGWIQRDGISQNLTNIRISSEYRQDSLIHEVVHLTGEIENGERIEIEGLITCVCPTKIPMPGGAIFVNEGLAQFQWNNRTGYGIAEHWHAVKLSSG